MRKSAMTAVAFVALIAASAVSGMPIGAVGHRSTGGDRVTICHRTDSETNPYVRVTVTASSTDVDGHEDHTGSVWFNGHPKEPKWGDIIPPTDDDRDASVTPLNWNAAGQAIWHNNCMPPFGPPPQPPTITCKVISVDPPATSWITVTFIGTINGVPFSRSVSYGVPTPHLAIADISDLTTATGPLHIVAYAIWTLGPGHSQVADVTITCH